MSVKHLVLAAATIALTGANGSPAPALGDEQFAKIERTQVSQMLVGSRSGFPVRSLRLPMIVISGRAGTAQRVTIRLHIDENEQIRGAFGLAIEPPGADELIEGFRTTQVSRDEIFGEMTVPGATTSSAYCSVTCPMNLSVVYVATYPAGSTLTLDLLWSSALPGFQSPTGTFSGYVQVRTDPRAVRRL